MKKARTRRYSNQVERTFSIESESSVRLLRTVKIIVAVLLLAVVVGTVIIGSILLKSGESERKSAAFVSSDNSVNDELLRVVNKTNSLDKDYVPELSDCGGYRVSVLADSALKTLLNDAEKSGIKLGVESAYVSYNEQKVLYKKRFAFYKKQNLTEVRAQAKAEADVPQAGNSEAQTGLLVTFKTDGEFKGSKASRWLKDNCVKYGFVWRYPSDKTDETSMNVNFKAYRFVGQDSAKIMRSLNKTLNEYVLYINSR